MLPSTLAYYNLHNYFLKIKIHILTALAPLTILFTFHEDMRLMIKLIYFTRHLVMTTVPQTKPSAEQTKLIEETNK